MGTLSRSPRFHASIAALVVVALIVLTLTFNPGNVSLLVTIFMCGATGGFISTYLRLRKLPIVDTALMGGNANTLAILQVYVGPVIGGALGLVLYALALTGLVGGDLFPEFANTEDAYTDISTLFTSITPATNIDAAKGLIWGFIAGFGEMLVPNILDRIIAETQVDGDA